ncbi:hypothetical protein EIZ39_20245 [Ammoniphilus sp. CFH 90114]|nr:hypothetical protein [Ammoniphilus sp. CFH 90114]RXT04547.1 hypothetical protein EIZ39_20245 [Ammoniphilus sp. CFH 90114]
MGVVSPKMEEKMRGNQEFDPRNLYPLQRSGSRAYFMYPFSRSFFIQTLMVLGCRPKCFVISFIGGRTKFLSFK